MAKGKGFFESRAFKITMNKVYGLGAAVVILGAMFKILHLEGANIMIGVGLTTEAMIFAISAFEPVHEEPDWTLVYPELAGMDPKNKDKKSLTKTLDQMLEEAKIEQNTITRLGESFKGLNDSVSKLAHVGNAATATDDYAKKATEAAGMLTKLNNSYTNAITAMDGVGKAVEGLQGADQSARNMKDEFTKLNKNLATLNNIYGNMLSAMTAPKS